MASSEEVVVARVDVGGSGGRDVDYKHRVYKKLTMTDVDDLQLVGLHLKQEDLIDPAKVAVWGWVGEGVTGKGGEGVDGEGCVICLFVVEEVSNVLKKCCLMRILWEFDEFVVKLSFFYC